MVISKGCVDDKISCIREMNPKKYIDKKTGTSMIDDKKCRLLNYIKGSCSFTYQTTVVNQTRLSEVII